MSKNKKLLIFSFSVLVILLLASPLSRNLFKNLKNEAIIQNVLPKPEVKNYYDILKIKGGYKIQKLQIANAIYQHELEMNPDITKMQKMIMKKRIMRLTEGVAKPYSDSTFVEPTENGKLKNVFVFFDNNTVYSSHQSEFYMDTTVNYIHASVVFT